MIRWPEDGAAADEAHAQEAGVAGAYSPEEEDFEEFSPLPRPRRHSQSSRRSSRSSRQSRRSQTSRCSKDSQSGEQARQKFADRTSMGSAFSMASMFETYTPTPDSDKNWCQIFVPLTIWLVSILATIGVAVLTYSVKGFVLTEGSFGYDTQVSDAATSQLRRWQRAERLAERDVGLGLPRGGVDSTTDYVTWRRVTLIYQLPGADAVSSVGFQRAKAVEDAIRSLAGWQRLCGEMPSSYQVLCREGDSMVSASHGSTLQVSASQVAMGVSSEIALDGNGSQVLIDTETLTRIMEGKAPSALDRWLPKDASGVHGNFAFRSSFVFGLRLESAAASWADLILGEVEPLLVDLGVMSAAREEQDEFRVYLQADNLPQLQANELRRSMNEDLPLLVFGPVSAFVATLLRGRLLVALTAGALAFAVPVIASTGLLEVGLDQQLGGVEVRIVAAAAWFLIAAGVADLSTACAHALEERRESLRLMAPQWLVVRLLAQRKPQSEASPQVLLYVVEELHGIWAVLLKVGRFAAEALLPTATVGLMLLLLAVNDLELVGDFSLHAGLGLLVCVPLTALMVPPAVDAGDAIASRVQAWREASDFELSEALQTLFDNVFPFEFGARQDLAMDLKLKMRKRMRDFLRVRWSTISVAVVLGGLLLTYLVMLLLEDVALFTAETPKLFEVGHRLHDKAAIVGRFDFPGDYETPLRDGLRVARRCFPWAKTAAECTWYQCEAGEPAADEEPEQCRCYQKQVSVGCSGSAARLFGLSTAKAQALFRDGIFWSWVGARLGQSFPADASNEAQSFLELEVWATGGRRLDDGVQSEVSGAAWDTACLQVLCYCSGLQCRDTWGSSVGVLATGSLNATAHAVAAEPTGSPSSNSSGTVNLAVAWGIQVSSDPLSVDLDRGLDFSGGVALEDLQTQRQLLAFCQGTDPKLVILHRRCWPIEFKQWLTERGSYYPVTSDLFYPSLRMFFQEQLRGSPSATASSAEQDLGGFWLSSEGTATALYFTFEVAAETDGSLQPLQLSEWQDYVGLRAASSGSLGKAWLPPTSAVLEQGQIATAAVVAQSSRSAATFCILFPALLVLLLTWSWGLALTTSLLLALTSFVVEFHHIRVNQEQVGVLDIVSLIAYKAMIALGLLRACMHVAWCQDGSGRDPQKRLRKQVQAQKIGLLSVLMGICSEEGDGRPAFLLRSLSADLAARPGGQVRKSVEDLTNYEQKVLLRSMDHLNSPFVSLAGLRHERLGRASRGSCRAGQEVFTTFIALVIGSAPVLFTSLTGIAQVCLAGLLGGTVSLLLMYCLFPVLMMLGLGPSRVKQRALALLVWWLSAGKPRPSQEKTPPGLLDTDLGALGIASAEVLGPPFSWLARTGPSRQRAGGDDEAATLEDEVIIKNLDLQGATAAPPFHVASVFTDKLSGSG